MLDSGSWILGCGTWFFFVAGAPYLAIIHVNKTLAKFSPSHFWGVPDFLEKTFMSRTLHTFSITNNAAYHIGIVVVAAVAFVASAYAHVVVCFCVMLCVDASPVSHCSQVPVWHGFKHAHRSCSVLNGPV